MTRLAADVLDVLRHQVRVDSAKRTAIILAELDPELYGRVAAVLVGLGGKYAGIHAKGTGRHAFKADPAPLLDLVLATGEDNPGDFFATPEPLADYVAACLDVATLPPEPVVLEPSYGAGALARAVVKAGALGGRLDLHILGVEQNPGLARQGQERAAGLGHLTVICGDLLSLDEPPQPIHAAVMNPPFGKRALGPGDWSDPNVYIRHILRVWSWLPAGGRMVAIAPAGWTFRSGEKAVTLPAFLDGDTPLSVPQFRAFVDRYGRWAQTRGGLFEATAIPVTVIVLGRVDGSPPAMPDLPADLAPQERKVKASPYDGMSLEELITSMDATERETQAASLNLKRMLAGILRPAGPTEEPCPGCTGGVGEGEAATATRDSRGRPWHLSCARSVLAQFDAGGTRAEFERGMAAIEAVVSGAVREIESVEAELRAPVRPTRGRRVVAAQGQIALEL